MAACLALIVQSGTSSTGIVASRRNSSKPRPWFQTEISEAAPSCAGGLERTEDESWEAADKRRANWNPPPASRPAKKKLGGLGRAVFTRLHGGRRAKRWWLRGVGEVACEQRGVLCLPEWLPEEASYPASRARFQCFYALDESQYFLLSNSTLFWLYCYYLLSFRDELLVYFYCQS